MKKEINKELFENYPIPKAVWSLALPMIASMIVTVFYNLADTFFVGQTNDYLQVSAVSLTMPVFMMFMAFGNLFGIGGSSSISRFLGAHKTEDIKHVSAFCFYCAIAVGLILGTFVLNFMDKIVPLTGATDGTYDYVYEYLTYIACGAPFIIISQAFANITRSVGYAKQAMVGMMLGTLTNIILDPIMILYLDMGVIGAAVATVIGNIAATIYYIILHSRKGSVISISPRNFKLYGYIVSAVLTIGIPGALNGILMSTANIIYNGFLSDYGDEPVAAMGIAMKVTMMMVMCYLGMTMGSQPLVGYNYGAQNYDRMKDVIKYILRVVLGVGFTLTIVFMIAAPHIVGIFIDDDVIVSIGTKMLRIQASTGCILGIMFVSMSALQSMGKAKSSLLLSVSRQGLLFIPAAYIADKLWGLDGLVCAQPIADFITICLAGILLTYTLRKLKNTEDISE